MQRRQFTSSIAAPAFARLAGVALLVRVGGAFALGESEAAAGVREAIERGADSAVALLGRRGGFLDNPQVRIALPVALDSAAQMLRSVGQGARVDELVTSMNRAAESAVPEARPLLVSAVKSMSVEDAVQLVHGGDDSVSRFFEAKTRQSLEAKFLPIVSIETAKVSLAAKYNAVAGKGSMFGLVRPEDANVERYVTREALDGLYRMIAQQERQIRADPMATGSALLKAVFGH